MGKRPSGEKPGGEKTGGESTGHHRSRSLDEINEFFSILKMGKELNLVKGVGPVTYWGMLGHIPRQGR